MKGMFFTDGKDWTCPDCKHENPLPSFGMCTPYIWEAGTRLSCKCGFYLITDRTVLANRPVELTGGPLDGGQVSVEEDANHIAAPLDAKRSRFAVYELTQGAETATYVGICGKSGVMKMINAAGGV